VATLGQVKRPLSLSRGNRPKFGQGCEASIDLYRGLVSFVQVLVEEMKGRWVYIGRNLAGEPPKTYKAFASFEAYACVSRNMIPNTMITPAILITPTRPVDTQ